MHRREILTAVGAMLAACLPGVAAAQPKTSIPRIGFLAFDRVPAYEDAFRDGLRTHGYVDGQTIRIDFRYVAGRHGDIRERQNAAAAELVGLNPDVVVGQSAFSIAFKRIGARIPVVFVAVSDPVGFGLVSSLARPGGNFTGLSYQGADLNVKRLEILKDAFPNFKLIGVLGTRTHPLFERARQDVQSAASALNVQIDIATIADGHPEEIDDAITTLVRRRVGALLALQGGTLYLERRRIVDLALKHRLPAMFEMGEWAELGGLMAYSANTVDLSRRAAEYVVKILKGAKPADLPVEQPTKFELVINLKTAKALGLTLPPSLLLRADHTIE